MLEGCVPWPAEVARRYRAEGLWQGETLGGLLRAWAAARPGKAAVIAGERRLSYRALDAAADRLGSSLLRLGIRARDRVVLHLPNIPEFLVTCFALYRIGAVPVFALPAHREHEVRYFCEHADAVAYVIPAGEPSFDYVGLARSLRRGLPALQHVVVVGGDESSDDQGMTTFEALLASAPDEETARSEVEPLGPDASDVAFFLLSGGTTGLPKLIPRTHDDYAYNLTGSAAVCGLEPDAVYLAALPISHNFPFGCPGALGTLHAGGTVVLTRDPSAASAFEVIERTGVTMTALVPALAIRWMNAPERGRHDLSSLRLLQVGGAKLGAEVARSVRTELGCGLQQVFGMAEGLLNYTRPDDPSDVVVATQGRPMSPADELVIVDEAGEPVAEGAAGELLTRGPYTLRGYYRAEAHNARAFTPEGYYRTGDIVRWHPSGNLVVEGRAKDLINRGGEKISAEEVEDLVLAHPKVLNVAAVAMPDPELGERTCVYVVPRGPDVPSLGELAALLADRGVARFKWPERLELVDDLPVTSVGKVDKRALRERIAARLAVESPT